MYSARKYANHNVFTWVFFNDLKKYNINTNSYNKSARGVAGLEKH